MRPLAEPACIRRECLNRKNRTPIDAFVLVPGSTVSAQFLLYRSYKSESPRPF